ncbi:MAG: DUF4271 domain-containing protein [Paramuribaculum sp.]|nr:DUF4271 domain-containing protein [Paramuribaculum sp.]
MGQFNQTSIYNEEPEIIIINTDSGDPIKSSTGDYVGMMFGSHTERTLDYSLIEGKVCTYSDLPSEPGAISYKLPYSTGFPTVPRPVLPGYDTGVASYVFGMFIFVALNLRHYSSLLKGFMRDLFSIKPAENVFEDHKGSVVGVVLSLILFLCVNEGIVLNNIVKIPMLENYPKVVPMIVLACVAICFYIWQIVVYNFIGYVFAHSKEMKRIWLRGFNASQVLLGLILWVPALITLFDPTNSKMMLIVSACLYAITRLIFIVKGFRIFYTNIYSLIYFILYFCSLEIIPLLTIYNIINYLTLS